MCSTFLIDTVWLCVLTYFEHDSCKFENGFDYLIATMMLQPRGGAKAYSGGSNEPLTSKGKTIYIKNIYFLSLIL